MDFAVFKLYYIFLHLYFVPPPVKGGGSGGSLYSERVACGIYGSLFKDI